MAPSVASDCALVVDDDPVLLEVASALLRKRGMREVVLATDGAAALEALARHQGDIALVLCDLQMPKMDGIAFLRGLADRRYTGRIVIVSAMGETVRSLASQVGRSHGLRIVGALAKPLVAAKLNALLDGAEADRASAAACPHDEPSKASLAEAIASGAIVPHYQPKLEMATGRIVGAEALARWLQPGGTVIAPNRFVPLAQRVGLVCAIDHAILRAAIADLPRLQALDPCFGLSVNAVPQTLDDIGFYDTLVALFEGTGLQHQALTLEITESQAVRKTTSLMEVLGRLRLAGFALSIDDFGTGHSNFETLLDFPFTEIKIDRSFVKDALSSASASASVEACLLMGREMGLNIVAEGVETRQHWQFLEKKGATAAQGYYIAKPMPLQELLQWMQRWDGVRLDAAPASAA